METVDLLQGHAEGEGFCVQWCPSMVPAVGCKGFRSSHGVRPRRERTGCPQGHRSALFRISENQISCLIS
nr:hypothetical protein XAC3615_12880002 [Xanthomonas citri pv. citri]